MNKLITKIIGACLGLSMAAGVGIGVAVGNQNMEIRPAEATSYDFSSAIPSGWTTSMNNTTTEANDRGVGWGAAKGTITLTLSNSTQITDVTITASTNNTGNKLSVSVGGDDYDPGETDILSGTSNKNKDYSFTGSSSGNVVVTIEDNNKTVWIKAISVTTGGGTVTDWELTTGNLTIATQPSNTDYYIDDDDSDINKSGAVIEANYWSASSHSTTKQVDVTEDSGLVWSLNLANSRIDLTYTDSNNDTQSGTISITVHNETRPLSVLYDATAVGYTDQQEVTSWSDSGNLITITFDKGSNSNAPKYYTNGSAVRIYGGGTITVSSTTKNIVGVTFTFGSSDGSNAITANVGTFTSPSWSGESSSVQFTIGGTTGNRRIAAMAITYVNRAIITPTKTTAEWKNNTKTIYNGSTNASLLSSTDVYVYEKDASDNTAQSHLSGTGFILKIYKNGTLTYTLDASTETQSQSFNGLDASSGSVVWTVKATVGSLTESTALTLTVLAKETTSLTWAENYEQTGQFVSYAHKLHIDGRIHGEFSDGSTGQDYRITTEIYSGSSAVAANLIYTRTVSKTVHNNGYDITAATEEGKTLSVDSAGRLAYSSATTFYVQMYYADYPTYKVGKTISVVIPSLYAEDANTFNYYVGTTRTTAANVSLKYNNEVVRELSDEYILNPTSVTPANTSPITVTVEFTGDSNLTTTYSITPVQPASLAAVELYNNSGVAMTDGEGLVSFNAGESFRLFNKINETYFLYAMDEDANEYLVSDYNDLSFELLASSSAIDGSGSPISTATYMRLNMNNKWVRATYSQGQSSIQFTYQLAIGNAVIGAYSEGTTLNYYEKVTDLSTLSSPIDCIVAVTIEDTTYAFDGRDAANGYTTVTVDSSNHITYSESTAKLACVITKVTDGYAIQVSATSDNHSSKYISGTYNSNSLNFNDNPVTLTIEATEGRTSTGGAWDIWSNSDKFSFNGTTNNNRFRFYKSTSYNSQGYYAVDLYKRAGTSGQGNKIQYLKDVVDAYRLNNDTDVTGQGISVCNEQSGIYSSDYWKGTNGKISVKTLFQGLSSAELEDLNVQDKFGETGKTYVDTYLMLLDKEPTINNSRLVKGINSNVGLIIIIISTLSLTATGAFFLLRKKKEVK